MSIARLQRLNRIEKKMRERSLGVYYVHQYGDRLWDGMLGCWTTQEAVDRLLKKGYQVIGHYVTGGYFGEHDLLEQVEAHQHPAIEITKVLNVDTSKV